MNRKDRTKKLLHEILYDYSHRWFTGGESLEKFIEELAGKYDIYLKSQDNQFQDE
jgi:hypothetical protein